MQMRVYSKMQLSLCLSSCKQVHSTESAKENWERSIQFTVQARVGIVYESKSSNAVGSRVDIRDGGKISDLPKLSEISHPKPVSESFLA